MTMLLEEATITSKHLRGSAELLLLIPIKPGFVHVPETVSYATRLKALLAAFFDFRKRSADITLKDTPQPIELLEIIYAAQWTVLEQERMLLVAVTFDRSWEEYFARLKLITGFLLDALFMHCVGYDGHTSLDGFTRFTEWIRSHQRPTDFLFHSNPDLTTHDIRSLRTLARQLGSEALDGGAVNTKEVLEQHRLGDVMAEAKKEPLNGIPSNEDLRIALLSLYELRGLFPRSEVIQQRRGERSAELIFDQSTASLLDPVFQLIEEQYRRIAPPNAPAFNISALVGQLELNASGVDKWVVDIYNIGVALRSTPVNADAPQAPMLPSGVIQANILRPIPEQTHGAIVLMQCHGKHGLATLLSDQLSRISWESGEASATDGQVFCNLAITYGGLTRAQLPEATLKLFPKEFREGMEQRAALLGDIGEPNHPYFWQRPQAANDNGRTVSLAAVDVVVIVQARDRAQIDAELARLGGVGDTNYSVLHVQSLKREHLDAFGLREGFSQPKPLYSLGGRVWNDKADAIDQVPLGEILLGQPDREHFIAPCAQDQANRELFENSTFLVMRKLDQDATQLQKILRSDDSGATDAPKSRLVGRTVADLVNAPHYDLPNNFDYVADPSGARCPLQSHVRLSNPRHGGKTNAVATPRIMRRGFSYNDGEAGGRGLMFMAYNASITSQYEVIQRWLNAGNVTGLFSWQNDYLTAPVPALRYPHAYGHQGIAAHQPPAVGERCVPTVKLRWGLYLFVPTKQSISWLITAKPVQTPEVQAGRQIIESLRALALSRPAEAVQEWKRFIEDPAYDLQASAIWAAIRVDGGELNTPYGRLVATLDGARSVLENDGSRYSVEVYGSRLEETLAPHYLGMDAYTEEFEQLSAADACFNSALTPAKAYEDARNAALDVLAAHRIKSAGRKTLWVEKHFAKPVVRALAEQWFGIPAAAEGGVDIFDHLVDVSRYSFQPHPAASLAAQLRAQRAAALTGVSLSDSALLAKELEANYRTDLDPVARKSAIQAALIGGAVGFSAPAMLQIVSVLDKWIESDEIGWLSERIYRNGSAKEDLLRMLMEALARRPVPPLLYRSDVRDGARVVVGLGSVYRDVEQNGGDQAEPAAWLFGGRNRRVEAGAAPHACPVRSAALQAILGALTALLEQKELKRESRFVISFLDRA